MHVYVFSRCIHGREGRIFFLAKTKLQLLCPKVQSRNINDNIISLDTSRLFGSIYVNFSTHKKSTVRTKNTVRPQPARLLQQQKGKGVWMRWAGLVIFSTQQGKSATSATDRMSNIQICPKLKRAPFTSTGCRGVCQNGANFMQITLNLGRGREKLAQTRRRERENATGKARKKSLGPKSA